MGFVHLHRHSEYSRLDGIGTAKQYAERAAALGQPALAQTDHGTLSGALHHILACWNRDDKGKPVREGSPIVPISGVEAYFRPDRRKAKEEQNKKAWHLCLFAKNLKGWHSLLQIVSKAYGEVEDGGGFYNYPCVDWDLLERYNEGIVCSTACISSWLGHLVNLGHSPEIRSYIQRMRRIFGDDLWIEIMPHDWEDQRVLNLELVEIAEEYSIPVIATNDAHFPYPEWAETHRMAKIMGSGSSLEKAKQDAANGKAEYLAELNPNLYLASEDEMRGWFTDYHPDIPERVVDESIENTVLFAQSCKPFLLDRSTKLPKVTESKEESEAVLRSWIDLGLDRIFREYPEEHWGQWPKQVYRDRVEREWKVLKDKGVIDYFVMVGDIVRWAQSDLGFPEVDKDGKLILVDEETVVGKQAIYKSTKEPIRVGLGRGSAAGCLISYLVGIVQIDPISYGLLFERFLNPNRKGLPDIDLDFQSDRRGEVKQYIARRYGQEHVADIITHTTFQPKKVLQDLARAFDFTPQEQSRLTKPIEIRQDAEETTLEEITPLYPHLEKFRDANPELWQHALRLEGQVANAGKHAAGVIITPKPIWTYMALERGKSGDLVTSWADAADFQAVSDHGFVKLDALGIKGLEIHAYACKLIEERTGKKINLYALDALRDPNAVDQKVMDGFRQGLTVGVFQFGSRGITKLIKDIKPDTILDIAAANALYRPGPLKGGVTFEFPKRKNNRFMRSYIHPTLAEWLSETYGLIAYQEQVMQVSGGIGRLSAGDTDDMRKAMGKLYRIKGGTAAKDFMRKYEVPFFDGAMEDHGWTHEEAEKVWNMFLEFGHYGFNKSHSASYALQAYQDMYLKMNYPHEFYAAILTYEEDEEKIRSTVREARTLGIEMVPPLLNQSGEGYTTDGNVIRLGLTAIKGMGAKSAKAAIRQRPFKDAEDFFVRGKGVPFRPLLESGACDDFVNRPYLLSIVQKQKRDGTEEPMFVWEWIKHNTTLKKPREVPKFRQEPSADMIEAIRNAAFTVPMKESSMDAEAVEYITDHCTTYEEYVGLEDGDEVIIGGEIITVTWKTTKKGDDYCNVRIGFDNDEFFCKIWGNKLPHCRHLLIEGTEVMARGEKDVWNDFESVVIDEMVSVEDFFAEEETEEEEDVASASKSR